MTSYSALFSQAVAERLGIHHTDMETMDLLNLFGPMSAGEMAERTGLSTGATTRLIDRLEAAGFVRRTTDPRDRRRVIIEPTPPTDKIVLAVELYGEMGKRQANLWAMYSAEQLETIVDFFKRSNDIMKEENARLRAEAEHG
jgi:DNA-binding MarR family transcriptional regulator